MKCEKSITISRSVVTLNRLFTTSLIILSLISLITSEILAKYDSNENSETNSKSESNLIQSKHLKQKKYKWLQKEVDIIGGTSAPNNDVECHRAAVWKCGHAFIRAHKFLSFIGAKDSFEPKCALRAAFFGCLKSSRTQYCHKQRSSHTKKFRKRLADTLWSTRACLLGVDNNYSHNL